jgi:hypothetical protein
MARVVVSLSPGHTHERAGANQLIQESSAWTSQHRNECYKISLAGCKARPCSVYGDGPTCFSASLMEAFGIGSTSCVTHTSTRSLFERGIRIYSTVSTDSHESIAEADDHVLLRCAGV